MDSILMGVKQAFQFQGRTSRADYVIFVIACWLFVPIFFRILHLLTCDVNSPSVQENPLIFILFVAEFLAKFYLAIASISIGVRRCHDCGWSGWASLIAFIPIVGVLILSCKKGDLGENRYGKAGFKPWAA